MLLSFSILFLFNFVHYSCHEKFHCPSFANNRVNEIGRFILPFPISTGNQKEPTEKGLNEDVTSTYHLWVKSKKIMKCAQDIPKMYVFCTMCFFTMIP